MTYLFEDTKANCGIYAIISPSGKRYIGSALDMNRRRREHLSQLRRDCHPCRALQHAFNKYGESDMSFARVELCEPHELYTREQAAMDRATRRRLYNTVLFAGGSLGFKHAEESKALMSAKHKGVPKSAEHRAAISAATKGRKLSDSTKRKLAELGKLREFGPEFRAACAKAQTGRVHSVESREKRAVALTGRKQARNTSGFVGVSKNGANWQAYVTRQGKRSYVGTYPTPEAAAVARDAWLEDNLTP